jgi:hypothetical protein
MTVNSLQANEYHIRLQLNMHTCIHHIIERFMGFPVVPVLRKTTISLKFVQLFLSCYKQTDRHGEDNRHIFAAFSCEHT